jgi:glycosyltransferase involved in cell wall biosynthesis
VARRGPSEAEIVRHGDAGAIDIAHKRPRILFVCSEMAIGGAERQLALLIPRLREYDFKVSLLTLVREGPFFDEVLRQGVKANCARMRNRTDLAGFRRALQHAKEQPDLVVTHSINAHVIGHVIARRAHAFHVATEHAGPGVSRGLHRAVLARIMAPRADLVIAISRAQIPKLLDLGYRPERIRVVHNAAPDQKVTQPAALVRSSLGYDPADFIAVFVGALRPEKSADIFVRAVQDAHRLDPRIRGLVVGTGPELHRLQKAARNDGVVKLIGERLDVADFLNAADAVCLSSRAEGTPMVLLEAMALGKPVVATAVGGVPEVVEDQKTGLLVAPGDREAFTAAVRRLASSPGLGQRLGRAARERHRMQFSPERMVAAYAGVLEEVLVAGRSALVTT